MLVSTQCDEKIQTFLDCTKEVNEFLVTSSSEILKDIDSIQKHEEMMAETAESMSKGAMNTRDSITIATQSCKNAVQSAETVTAHALTSVEMLKKICVAVRLGQSTIEAQKEAMLKNQAAMEQLLFSMNNVRDKASEIGGITKMIDKIALSTKVLSINASIEAARAGSFGKGFGVVAQEIKEFASNSEDQAKQINQIAEDIYAAIDKAHSNINDSKLAVTHQVQKVEEVTVSFDDIVESVMQVDVKIQGVCTENKELEQNVKNVQIQFESISTISSQTAASTSEVSDSIREQMQSINDIVLKIQELDNMTKELNVIIQDYEQN